MCPRVNPRGLGKFQKCPVIVEVLPVAVCFSLPSIGQTEKAGSWSIRWIVCGRPLRLRASDSRSQRSPLASCRNTRTCYGSYPTKPPIMGWAGTSSNAPSRRIRCQANAASVKSSSAKKHLATLLPGASNTRRNGSAASRGLYPFEPGEARLYAPCGRLALFIVSSLRCNTMVAGKWGGWRFAG